MPSIGAATIVCDGRNFATEATRLNANATLQDRIIANEILIRARKINGLLSWLSRTRKYRLCGEYNQLMADNNVAAQIARYVIQRHNAPLI
jgi:hypothetical protein